MVRDYRSIPENAAKIETAKRRSKVIGTTKRERERGGPDLGGFYKFPRGAEIAPSYDANSRTMIAGLVNSKPGKEIWSLILQAKDAGFLTSKSCGHLPSIRHLFHNAPVKWANNYMLTEAKDRAYIRDELMPAAIENKVAILAEPERIEIILREHFARVGHAKKIAEVERKAEVAKQVMSPNEKEVFLFGKRFWPIVENANSNYDYDQLTAAWFTFNAMLAPGKAGKQSPGSCAHAVRFAVQSLMRYANAQADCLARTNFRRVFYAMLAMADALEANPDGKFDPPLKPLG